MPIQKQNKESVMSGFQATAINKNTHIKNKSQEKMNPTMPKKREPMGLPQVVKMLYVSVACCYGLGSGVITVEAEDSLFTLFALTIQGNGHNQGG